MTDTMTLEEAADRLAIREVIDAYAHPPIAATQMATRRGLVYRTARASAGDRSFR